MKQLRSVTLATCHAGEGSGFMFGERWTIGVYTIPYNTCLLLQKYLKY